MEIAVRMSILRCRSVHTNWPMMHNVLWQQVRRHYISIHAAAAANYRWPLAIIAAALLAVQQRCPGIPIGVSTSIHIEADPDRRLQLLREWTIQPDFVSVNFSEPGAAELCTHFLARNVGIEAGLWTVQDVQLFLDLDLADRCLRILIEVQELEVDTALKTAEAIIHYLDDCHVQLPRLLHGDHDAIAWPMLDVALRYGYDTRIGLEDTLTLPSGERAKDNAELVALAVDRARQMNVDI